jgi:hypothetical protein
MLALGSARKIQTGEVCGDMFRMSMPRTRLIVYLRIGRIVGVVEAGTLSSSVKPGSTWCRYSIDGESGAVLREAPTHNLSKPR